MCKWWLSCLLMTYPDWFVVFFPISYFMIFVGRHLSFAPHWLPNLRNMNGETEKKKKRTQPKERRKKHTHKINYLSHNYLQVSNFLHIFSNENFSISILLTVPNYNFLLFHFSETHCVCLGIRTTYLTWSFPLVIIKMNETNEIKPKKSRKPIVKTMMNHNLPVSMPEPLCLVRQHVQCAPNVGSKFFCNFLPISYKNWRKIKNKIVHKKNTVFVFNFSSIDFDEVQRVINRIEKKGNEFQAIYHIFFQPAFHTTFFFQKPGSWTCWSWTWWCSWWWSSLWWNKFPKRSKRCCATCLLDACEASAVWSSNLTAFVDTCDLWSSTPSNIYKIISIIEYMCFEKSECERAYFTWTLPFAAIVLYTLTWLCATQKKTTKQK